MSDFKNILSQIEERIAQLNLAREPKGLYEPIAYTMSAGGKRIRPLLTVLASNMFKTDATQAITAGVALEMFHNFTLLHDDLMDRAPIRRGKPTVHIKWNDNTAILSGDTMLIEAYRILATISSSHLTEIYNVFNCTAQEICEGQQFDMEFETRNNITEEEYIEMIRLKTSVLLGACLKIGALTADASIAVADKLYQYGINLGLAFQLRDDWLDSFGNQANFGKRIGGDIVCNKKTFLLINAMRQATGNDADELKKWIAATEFDENEKIEAVRSIFKKLKIDEQTQQKIEQYSKKADAILAELKAEGLNVSDLETINRQLLDRNN
ncbi:MAG: polyprenyl synthetase family protein [Salinivirgaceae bacterium]|nr:polyprenyl synthetase family protein [Salinivirgaceae bacterium]